MALIATPSQPVLLGMLSGVGRTDLYGQAKIYNSSGTLVTTISVNHVAGGIYSGSWTPSTEGYYQVRYEFFTDVGRSVSAGYGIEAETIDVTALKTNVLRLLGLVHENSVIDQHTYDSSQNLTSARIRCFDSSANAAGAAAISPSSYSTGLLFSYSVSASFSGTTLTKYSINRVL